MASGGSLHCVPTPTRVLSHGRGSHHTRRRSHMQRTRQHRLTIINIQQLQLRIEDLLGKYIKPATPGLIPYTPATQSAEVQ